MRFSSSVGYRLLLLLAIVLPLVAFCTSCKDEEPEPADLTAEDDIQLGAQLRAEILANPQEYPILNRQQYAPAYAYLDNMLADIRNGDQLAYKSKFNWEVNILHNDQVVNAFITPGGIMYINTATLKYINSGSEMAGFMAHLMAHADRRLVSEQLKRVYPVDLMLGVVMGENPSLRTEMAAGLVSLRFSTENEAEADLYSTIYLCPTTYQAAGVADFFEKLTLAHASGNTPPYLVTHPNPDNRLTALRNEAETRACGSAPADDTTAFRAFQNVLP